MVVMKHVCMCVCPDQVDGVTTQAVTAVTAATEEESTDVTSSEELVEYGPQLPDNYVPPSNEQASTVSDVSSRKRPAADDENPQDIDSMLDDALEVKRVRLDEGVLIDALLQCGLLQLEWLILQISC